jgi:diguanylate cyclase (GGDEF)-like protein
MRIQRFPTSIGSILKRIMRQTAFRLTLSLFIAVMVIAAVLAVIGYRNSAAVLEAEMSKSSQQTIMQATRHIDNKLQQFDDLASLPVKNQDFLNKVLVFATSANPDDYDAAGTQLLSMLGTYQSSIPSVSSITLFSGDQNRVVSTLWRDSLLPAIRNHNGSAIRQLDWMQEVLNAGEDRVFLGTRKDGYVSSSASEPMFAIARLIRSPFKAEVVHAILVVELSAGSLEQALSGLRLGTGGGYAIVEPGGKIIYAEDERSIETLYAGAMPTRIIRNEDGTAQGSFYAEDAHGINHYYAYQQSAVSGWYMIGYYPREELLAPMREMMERILWITILCGIAASLLVGYLVQRGVGSPLTKLRLLMHEGEKGNLNVRMAYRADNDIGDLGRAFNRMMDQITLAYYDTLTNLPNRRLLVDRMQDALKHAEQQDGQLAVLFVDIDRFKMVNDSLGHQAGDSLIQQVGQRLLACVQGSDTVARIAGDEYVILLPQATEDTAGRMAEEMLEVLRRPFMVLEQELFITGSIGIALYPTDGRDAETLVKSADMAMYEAKARGKNNLKRYLPEMAERSNERMRIENDLHRALEHDEFELYYQPRVDARSGRILGCEALIRWNHEHLGLVPPDRFIPVAEETGLIVPIGEWVLREACRQNKAWQDAGHDLGRVSVNVSAKQFESGLTETIGRILDETGLDGRWLEIEITESVLIENEGTIKDTLHRLKSRGIHLSIDDFGTGYSSLAFLMKFEVDTLKIDKSFIHDILAHPDNQMIASAVIQLAHNLGMKVVSEGVETQEEYDYLLSRGSDEVQGYRISKPLPARQYEQFIMNYQHRSDRE